MFWLKKKMPQKYILNLYYSIISFIQYCTLRVMKDSYCDILAVFL